MSGTATQQLTSWNDDAQSLRSSKSNSTSAERRESLAESVPPLLNSIFAGATILLFAAVAVVGIAWLGSELLERFSRVPLHHLPRILSGL